MNKTNASICIQAKWKTQLINALIFFLCLFSVSTLFQSLSEKVALNRIVAIFIVFILITLNSKSMELKNLIRILLLAGISVFHLFLSENFFRDLTDVIYILTTILVIIAISNKDNVIIFRRSLMNSSKIILILACIECFIVLCLLIGKIGYTQSSQWGMNSYFRGLCNSEHTMASLGCMLLAMLLVANSNRVHSPWLILLFSIIPSYAILQTGARIFLFPLGILLFFIIEGNVKARWMKFIVYSISILLGVYIAESSGMANKFIYALSNQYASNALSAFTSGRSEFWKADLNNYLSGNVITLLIGNGFSSIYNLNYHLFGIKIWSHNDIIHLLNCVGFIGCYSYISIILLALKRIKFQVRRLAVILIIYGYVFIPMLLNGFFPYQHLLYSFVFLYFAI